MTSPSPLPGKLIVFEGIDGTGKSTQIRLLAEYLEKRGGTVVTSYEPTHGQWGRLLRESATTGRFSLEEEVDLFLKDRKEHVQELILPALERGEYVLLDRYYFSMMAYQSARGMDAAEIREKNEEFAPIPDAVVWLGLSIKDAHERIGGRGEHDAFESTDILQHCHNVFSSIDEPWFLSVDAKGTPEEIAARVTDSLTAASVVS